MSSQVYHTETCSHCGLPSGPDHDYRQCKTIARAFVLQNANQGDETSFHIVQLARWLRDHPAPSTPDGQRAREDRLLFLNHWCQVARGETP